MAQPYRWPQTAPAPRAAWDRLDFPRPTRETVARTLWRALWSPFWAGSDVPAPHLPARDRRPVGDVGLAGTQVVRSLNGIARRVWLLRVVTILARALWLGPLVGCGWLLVELNGGPDFDPAALVPIGAVFFGAGMVFAACLRPTRARVARMLDRSFALHERMGTAVGNLGRAVPAEGERASIVYLQMADAANVVAELRRHPAFRLRLPLRELVLAVAVALLLAALYFTRGVGGGIDDATAGAVPPFTPAVERVRQQQAALSDPAAELADAPTTEEVRAQARRSAEAQQDLRALGDALDDHPNTREAADAIADGDYDAAADSLRDAAARADQMSQAAREGLADDLDQAAGQMSEGGQSLADASRQAAEGLRQGQQPAQDGVRELGDAVEQTGDEVASQQELSEQMERAEAADQARGDRGGSEGERQSGEGAQGEGQPGEGQPGEQGQPGEAGDPGQEGGDAQPGDPAQGQASDPGQEGQSGAQQGQEPGQEGAPDQGQGENPNQAGEGQGQPGAPAAAPQGREGMGEGAPSDQSQDGGGAGTGEGAEAEGGQAQDGQGSGAGDAPADENLQPPDDTAGQAGSGEPRDVIGSVELPRSGGPGVRTSADGGSSAVGNGAGVAARSGSTVQQEVGIAGPDSNRVPPGYRSLVENYFSEPDGEE